MENQKEQQNQIQIMIQILINNLHPKCKNVLYSFYEHNIYIISLKGNRIFDYI